MGARYNFVMRRTASTTLDVGSILAAAANPRRFKIADLLVGCEAAANDNQFTWEINKRTGTATGGTSVTGQPVDDGDTVASTLVGNQAPTANGAGTGNKLTFPLNQRATFRWTPSPGGEITAAAVASSGFGFSTPVGSALAVVADAHIEEL
jgi:hypothetical protein